MEPFYFGDRDAPLFGLYHPPSGPLLRDAAILLCSPIGHEQIISHRAFTQLSRRLSGAGFAVMRFDFYGSGDSAGACEEGSPQRWRRDIVAAIGSLRLRSACRRLAIVGCRFGATLAMLAGAERQDIASMVLWDPVSSGARYVEELSARHEAMLRQTHVAASRRGGHSAAREFLGMAMSSTAVDEIAAIDALTLPCKPAGRVLLVDSGRDQRADQLPQRLTALGSRVDCRLLPVENAWTWIEDVNKVLVPQLILNAIVSWISEVHA
ncbi:MAG TPA: alpha/beta hydrolase [Egibacteraceae bacterium]|nr:alpha/beta hydrolase [Egibacteraceae bacterium]